MRATAAALATLLLAFAFASALAQEETKVASAEEGASAEVAFTGLSGPVDIAIGPDGTLYYAAFMEGELRAVPPGGGEARTLWTAPDLATGGERGFVGLALAPDFAEAGAFYVFYQTNKSGTVVNRLSKVVDGKESILLDDVRSEKLHNGGRIAFGPDGLLYLSVGDAVLDTAGRKKSEHAHDPASLNGKVLRLTPDGKPAPGNPWDNEVWTKGHRNVYGLAVSPGNVVLATENGPESWDEVNLLEGGKDYGWPTCSGACRTDGYVDPLFAYESTIAPTGAVWHDGHFYFTDFNKGSLHRLRYDETGAWHDERVLKLTTPRILDVASDGEALYISTWDSVWRVVPAQTPSGWSAVAPPPRATPTTQIVTASPETATPTAPPTVEGGASIGDVREAPEVGILAYALVALAALLRGRSSFK